MEKAPLTVDQAAEKYQFRKDTILAAILKGKIDAEDRDGVTYIEEDAIGELVEARDAHLFSVDIVANNLSVSPKTVRRYIKDGKLKATRIGGQWRIRAKDMHLFMSGAFHDSRLAKEEQELVDFCRGDRSPIQGDVQACLILNVKAENAEAVGELRNRIIYFLNNTGTEEQQENSWFNYDYLKKKKTARFMFYDTPKFLAALIFDSIEKINEFAGGRGV